LPLPSWALVLGQLTAPVLLLGLIQAGLVVFVALVWGGIGLWGVAVVGLLLPVNFLMLAIDNLLFLVFPARLTPPVAGDFQAVGRQMLLLLAKLTVRGVACAVAAVVGLLAFAAAGGFGSLTAPDINPGPGSVAAALAAAWLVLAAGCAALVPVLAWA